MIDKELCYSNDQALTTTADSESHVDLGAGKDHKGDALIPGHSAMGRDFLNIVVTEAFVGGTSLAIALQDSADDSSFAALGNPITVTAVVTASLTLGAVLLRMPLPAGIRRYTKLVYTIVGTYTAGKVSAWVGPAHQWRT